MHSPLRVLLLLCLSAVSIQTRAQRSDEQMQHCIFPYRDTMHVQTMLYKNFGTLHFTPGERIADVGAKGGGLAGMLSINYKDLDITLEDLDSNCLNAAQLAFVLRYYAALSGRQPQGIHCNAVIGNDSSTTLPTAAYAKVFLMNTYHEITKQAAMLQDLHRILAAGGTLYVTETVSAKKHIRRRDCHHIMPIEREMLEAFTSAGFRLVSFRLVKASHRHFERVRYGCFQFQKV